MGNGHRPGHHARGREGHPSPPRGERILVLPGDEIPGSGLRPGPGTYRLNGRIYASVLGLLTQHPPEVRVVPLSGRYIPKPRDTVVGTVTDVQTTFWLLDIGAPRWAPLHMTGTPWKIEVGETAGYLRVGDAVAVSVESIESTGRIGVTMLGEGLGKLEGGTIILISPARVPRLIGRGGSMIQTITHLTATEIVVGQNGRIWVDGPAEGILRVREAIRIINEEGQRPGLTDRIHAYLEGSRGGPSGERPTPRDRSSRGRDSPRERAVPRPEDRPRTPEPDEGESDDPGASSPTATSSSDSREKRTWGA
ncbi:MAG: exosome complex RNA-binding protein Rrp4 [Thermoplasmata archaeon]